MYLITNEGLKILEKIGIKKILDSSFDKLEHPMLYGHIFDDEIIDYGKEHKLPNLLEKVQADGELYTRDSFIIHSEIIYKLLKKKLPKNMKKDIKATISAYYLYYDRFLKQEGYRGSYFWRDKKFLNEIKGDIHGDMKITQYEISPSEQLDLFNYKSPIKKIDSLKLIDGYYPFWIKTLIDFITFCIQIKKPVPFKENWEKTFYNGNFEERNPEYSDREREIEDLKRAKEGEKYSYICVLPFCDNPLKNINPDKNIFHTHPIMSSGKYLSSPFIDKNELVYLHKTKKGIEFLGEKWGNPGVRFSYEQISNAIKGLVSCIQNNGSRNSPQDPGLVFKYFPYKRYKELNKIN